MITSNGERLTLKHCEKRLPLKWRIVFEKEVIFHEFDFETSDLEFEVSKSSIWKHTTSCEHGATRVFFLSLISINITSTTEYYLRRPIELKFSQMCYFMHMLRYSNCELVFDKLLPIVSSGFKTNIIWKAPFKSIERLLVIGIQLLFAYPESDEEIRLVIPIYQGGNYMLSKFVC